jgi:hypothetical protein
MLDTEKRIAEALDILAQSTPMAGALIAASRWSGDDLRLLRQEICVQGMVDFDQYGMKAMQIEVCLDGLVGK